MDVGSVQSTCCKWHIKGVILILSGAYMYSGHYFHDPQEIHLYLYTAHKQKFRETFMRKHQ